MKQFLSAYRDHLVLSGIIFLITSIMTKYSLFYIEGLAGTALNTIWSILILPAAFIAIWITVPLFSLLGLLGVNTDGLIDGGPIDLYAMTFASLLIGLIYGFLLTWIFKKFKKRK